MDSLPLHFFGYKQVTELTWFVTCLKPPQRAFILCNLISWSLRVLITHNLAMEFLVVPVVLPLFHA
uniref:Uncharacterized protein n=1 Tax=Panthera leo TaxID=9689 RepID=A0A8C8X9E9_PANLE